MTTEPHVKAKTPVMTQVREVLVIAVILVGIALVIAWSVGLFKSRSKIALVTSTESPYWDRVIHGAEDAAKFYNIDLTIVRSKGDEKQQSQSIQDLVAKGMNGIGVSPVDAKLQTDLLKQVAAKVPLATFDSDCIESGRLVFVGTDNYVAGRQCAEEVRKALPDGGELIICVGSVQKQNGRDRRQGLIDNLLGRPLDPANPMDPLDAALKGDKYTIVATLVDDVDPARATTLAAEAITKHPNVKCFVGLFGYSTPALLESLKAAGKLGQITVIGFDEAEPTLAGVESGDVRCTLLQDQYNMGFDTVRFLAERTRGLDGSAPATRVQYLPCQVISGKEGVALVRFQKQREGKQQE